MGWPSPPVLWRIWRYTWPPSSPRLGPETTPARPICPLLPLRLHPGRVSPAVTDALWCELTVTACRLAGSRGGLRPGPAWAFWAAEVWPRASGFAAPTCLPRASSSPQYVTASGLGSGAPSRAWALTGREEQPRALMARVPSPLEACGSQGGRSSCQGPTVQPPGAHQQPSRVSSFPSSRVHLGALCGHQPSVCARRALSHGRGWALGRWCPPPLGVLGWFWPLNIGRGETHRGRPGLSRCVGEAGQLPGISFCLPVSMPPRSCHVL